MSSANGSRRRSTEEVRGLILASARRNFLANGYDATKTKEIARDAGVIEPLVYRHFGSKAGVFEASVITPFTQLIENYVASWERQSDQAAQPQQRVATFLDGLLELAQQNRALLITAVAHRDAGVGPDGDGLDRIATALQRIGGVSAIARDYPAIDPPAAVAVMGGMVFGLALLDPLLFARGARRPSRARLTAELTEILMRGISRPA